MVIEKFKVDVELLEQIAKYIESKLDTIDNFRLFLTPEGARYLTASFDKTRIIYGLELKEKTRQLLEHGIVSMIYGQIKVKLTDLGVSYLSSGDRMILLTWDWKTNVDRAYSMRGRKEVEEVRDFYIKAKQESDPNNKENIDHYQTKINLLNWVLNKEFIA